MDNLLISCLLLTFKIIFLNDALFSFEEQEVVVRRCSVKKVSLEILQNLQENTCARVSFLIKLQGWGLQLWHWCIPVNLMKFLRTPFSQNIPGGYFWRTPSNEKKKRSLYLETFKIKISSHWYLFILFHFGKSSKTKFGMSLSLRK